MSMPLNFSLVKQVSKAYKLKRNLAKENYEYEQNDREKKYEHYLSEFNTLREMAYILMELIEDQREMKITAEENYEQGLISRDDLVKIEIKVGNSEINLLSIFENMTKLIFKMAYMD